MSASTTILEEIWLCPPLAFARFGASRTPLESFHWADNDYAPRGTAETVVRPALTFRVEPDGSLSAYVPEEIHFRDKGEWRPLCPFFELHGRWSDGREGPLTMQALAAASIVLGDVRWTVEAANRKAYHYTLASGDLVSARLALAGDDHERQPLQGKSADGTSAPLVPPDVHVLLGHAQVIRPSEAHPELRLRITAPPGHIYAPTNTAGRDLSALLPGGQGKDAFLQDIHCILNANSPWTRWTPPGEGDDKDYRTNPGGLYAQEPDETSLGFLDDSNDGLIRVSVRHPRVAGGELTAFARYTCCPPDFQPDRRPFTSLADGLADAVLREQVLQPGFVAGPGYPETEREMADLMQRVRETMEASNLDHQNLRAKLGNDGIIELAELPAKDLYPFEPTQPRPGHPLPLLETGRANHARFLAYDVFKQRLAQRPYLFHDWIRRPTAERTFYDKQMPALMRGSDSYPMTLSQRQYDLMARWLEQVVQEGDEPEADA